MMLLAVDIGNTNIDLGLFRSGQLLKQDKWPTAAAVSEEVCRTQVHDWLEPQLKGESLSGAVVGSVVAGLGEQFVRACQALCAGPALQAKGEWDLGLTIQCDHPDRIGIDRLAAAAAAFAEIPTDIGAVVVDAGTAITVDAVAPGGTFLGGLILPGLRLGLSALSAGTSLLPVVELDPAVPLLGKNTCSCLQAGALHGGAALVDGLFDRIAACLGVPLQGFLTGGDSLFLWPKTTRFAHCDPALVLKGLHLAYARRLGWSY